MKYIDADRLKEAVEKIYNSNDTVGDRWDLGYDTACKQILDIIDSLQQEQQETDMKSPFTGGKVAILSRQEEVTFRGEKVKILRKYYRCEDTGREFTNYKLDDDMMWAVFRAYCEKKGMTSFTDIMLKQEQQEVDLEKLGGIARHLIAVKDHEEDMRLTDDEWLLLGRIGYPERFNARKWK